MEAPEKPPEMASVRLDRELIRKAAIIAQHCDTTIADVLTPHLLKPVQKAYEQAVSEMAAEVSTPAGA